ncbi:Uncharacterised protein [Klebsiella oxytoca]|nr:Uncharacterised protein [Klebsiella oxytoca]
MLCGGGRFSRGCLLARFARFGAGDRGLDGGLARVNGSRLLCVRGRFSRDYQLLSPARPRLGLTGFASGDGFAVIRFLAGEHDNRLRRVALLFTYAGKGGVNRILIFRCWLYGCLLMTFQPCGFIPFQASLTRLKADFRFRCAFLFLRNGVYLGFLLAEVLHQRDIAWTNPGAGTALDTIGEVMAGGFVVLLPFAEPV